MVTLIAIFGMLLATTLICGCTGSEKAPATQATTVPTITPEVTKVQTQAPVQEKAVETVKSEKNVTESNVTAPVATDLPVANKTEVVAEVKNLTKEMNTTAPAAVTGNITSGNTTEEIKEVAQKAVANVTAKNNATEAVAPVKAENKTAAL